MKYLVFVLLLVSCGQSKPEAYQFENNWPASISKSGKTLSQCERIAELSRDFIVSRCETDEVICFIVGSGRGGIDCFKKGQNDVR